MSFAGVACPSDEARQEKRREPTQTRQQKTVGNCAPASLPINRSNGTDARGQIQTRTRPTFERQSSRFLCFGFGRSLAWLIFDDGCFCMGYVGRVDNFLLAVG